MIVLCELNCKLKQKPKDYENYPTQQLVKTTEKQYQKGWGKMQPMSFEGVKKDNHI